MEDRQKVMMDFVYPLIAFAGLSVFLSALYNLGWSTPENYQEAMTRCCAVAVSLFGGFYLSAYLINRIGMYVAGRPDNAAVARQFTGYSMGFLLLLQIVYGLLPELFIGMLVLSFYTVYIVWVGSRELLHIREEVRLRFTLLASAVLFLCPLTIQQLFNKLMVMTS